MVRMSIVGMKMELLKCSYYTIDTICSRCTGRGSREVSERGAFRRGALARKKDAQQDEERVLEEKCEEEVMTLNQRELTVAHYEEKFNKLSKFALRLVDTEKAHTRQFFQGLH
ncbi:hypothetical protein ACH5RR_018322 [Cinchona calisaya]|uniref:Retrotransposon gag domain-containing protein n=1 Tax=Cinchona calisaya TaxID=153742 RepID=A0ABD2ZR88_9GENT